MAYPYQYPTAINFTGGFGDMFKYLNLITANWFSNMLLISIWVIFASGFYYARRDLGGAFAVAGFVLAVVGSLFWIADMISVVTLAIVIAVAIAGFISLWVID